MPSVLKLRRLVVALAALLMAGMVILVPAGPAWAHAQLVSSNPANGATVADPLTAITLTFNEPVKQQASTVVVTGADGRSYSAGAATVVDRTLTQAISPLPPGRITVAWRTVSPDGDPIQDRFTFTNTHTAPAAADPANSLPAAPTGSFGPLAGATADRSPSHAPLIITVSVVTLIAAVVIVVLVRRRGRDPVG